jgi:two-component system, OmpR family, KDP operon response regulator KdpE
MSEARRRILLVDDEAALLRVLSPALAAAGFAVLTAANGEEARRVCAQAGPDVILLDLGLPDVDGMELIGAFKEWSEAPVIVVSARHNETDRVTALDLGAHDYVTKPFHMAELIARVRAALRDREARRSLRDDVFSAGGLKVNLRDRVVSVDGQEIKLTAKEFDLLTTLCRHAGRAVSHEQLLAAGWGGEVADSQFVRVYVGQLRQKIEADPRHPRYLLTETGIGYRMVAAD